MEEDEIRKQVGELAKKLTDHLVDVDSEVAISALLAASAALAVCFGFDRDDFIDAARQNFVIHFAAKAEVLSEQVQ